MKKALSLSLAAAMALTSSVCVYAEGKDDAALRSALSKVKGRIEIPAELSEFSYQISTANMKDQYYFSWRTPDDAEKYGYMQAVICGTVVTSFDRYTGKPQDEMGLAKLSEAKLYKKAKAALKKLNPTVWDNIEIDRSSLRISLNGNAASFALCRISNGIPVSNDSGRITIDKNTGELLSFDINWHMGASFKKPADIISVDKAQDCYAEMIDIQPQYEIYYDNDSKEYKSRLVYTQTEWGEINAFTGKRSNFKADGFYSDDSMADSEESAGATNDFEEKGEFTPEELQELDKELPYATEKAITDLMNENVYLTYKDSMSLQHSYLRKNERTGRYIYNASFVNQSNAMDEDWYYDEVVWEEDSWLWEEVSISVDAETGEILFYNYYTNDSEVRSSYDEKAAEERAKTIADKFAGEKFGEYVLSDSYVNSYKDQYGNAEYYGSTYIWGRQANGIDVIGENIMIEFNADGMLTYYDINYTETEFASPDKMLSEDELMDKFWDDTEIELYYLARVTDSKTKTVLVYGTDEWVYRDAFTGEPVYDYYYSEEEADLSGLSKSLRKKAGVLVAHGIYIGEGRIDADEAVSEAVFASVLNYITDVRMYGYVGELVMMGGRIYFGGDATLTNGDAMIMFAAAECGNKVPELSGIFKSPYKDIKDSDKNVGYYAIAHALTGFGGDTLDKDDDFTYGDMIELVYGYLAD